jgi:hypothetical protein
MILWKLKDTLTADEKEILKLQIKQGLEGLVGVIPGLTSATVYIEGISSSTADMMLDSTFESETALKTYKTHPAHLAVADGLVRPNTQIRLCLDYIC